MSRAAPPEPIDLLAPTFRLSSLMLTMVLIGLCLAVVRLSTTAGVLVAAGMVPSFVRTVLAARQAALAGRPLNLPATIVLFVESIGAVSLIAIAALTATCVSAASGIAVGLWLRASTPLGEGAVLGGIMLGAALAITSGTSVAAICWRYLWPDR